VGKENTVKEQETVEMEIIIAIGSFREYIVMRRGNIKEREVTDDTFKQKRYEEI
jgi:hypothetical protein